MFTYNDSDSVDAALDASNGIRLSVIYRLTRDNFEVDLDVVDDNDADTLQEWGF